LAGALRIGVSKIECIMNFSAITLLFGLLFSGTFTSCNKSQRTGTEENALPQSDMKNVSYGSDTAQKMDVYLPEGRNTDTTKIILFIHGGSWSGGDKSEFNEAIVAIRKRLPDLAMFNMNYRLLGYGGINRFPAQIDDIKSALSFIKDKATLFNINPEKIVLVGASAGAHLALLQAYKYNDDGRIKAVVDLFGPTDLKDLYNNHPVPAASQPVLVGLLGATPVTNAAAYREASPINYVTATSVPTKIFHGGADFVVPVSQSIALKAKLQANNVKVDMTTYSQEGHGWYGTNLLDTYTKTVSFIKENVY
jgi:acetyl esterase/lipase